MSIPDRRARKRACTSECRSPSRSIATRCATSSRCAGPAIPGADLRSRAASGPEVSFHLGECALHPFAAVVDIGLADQHGGRDPDHVAVEAALADQQSLPLRGFEEGSRFLRRGLLGLAILDELDPL